MSVEVPTVTAAQYAALVALRDGTSRVLWPMMRKALRRMGLITPAGPSVAPSETRRERAPVRAHALTDLGLLAIEARAGEFGRARASVPEFMFGRATAPRSR